MIRDDEGDGEPVKAGQGRARAHDPDTADDL